MTTGRTDRLLLGLGALLILISSYQLFWGASRSSEGIVLGKLSSTLSVVKTKNPLSLDWKDASVGNEVAENQLIYTDQSSSAEVVFNQGGTIGIGESSLVKLQTNGKEGRVDLAKGLIRAKLDENHPLKVKVNGEEFIVSGENADIQINLQNKKGEIGVVSGKVKIESAGVEENLDASSALEINGSEIKKKAIYFKAISPAKDSILYVTKIPTLVSFNWEPQEAAKVSISRNQSFANEETIEGEPGIVKDLMPGLYYYRIQSAKGTSLISAFRIFEEKPIEVIRPQDGESISVLGDDSGAVFLQWKGSPQDQHLLEWNDGEAHEQIVNGTSKEIRVKKGESFSWRVKLNLTNRPEALWSSWQKVSLSFIPNPMAPTDLFPDEVEFQTFEKPNEKIDLTWKNSSQVELEIKDPSGKLDVRKVAATFSTVIATMGGEYSWRVRGIDNYLRTTEWSDWKKFRIEDLTGSKNAEGIQRIQLKKPDQNVTFNWKTSDGAVSVFELSKDDKFQTIVKKVESKKDSVSVSIPVVGAYYWRSREFLPDGSLHVSEPKRVIVEPTPAPIKPEKLPDLEVPLEEAPKKTTYLERMFNFIISSAHADEAQGEVHLTLPVAEEAKIYVIRIYADKELTKLIFEQKSETKKFVWKNTHAGEYFWQYAVIDYWDRQSPFSDPSNLIVKGDSSPYPEKPRLLSPIRAKEIDLKELQLAWTPSEVNHSFKVEVSSDDEFKTVISSKEVKASTADFSELELVSALYYWRVTATNKRGEIQSNTGRFTVLPPVEKTIIQDFPLAFKKEWKTRHFISWAPSMDSYTFKDGKTGKIDGQVLGSLNYQGTRFTEKFALDFGYIHQTGKVFKSEKYLFQRLTVSPVYLLGNRQHQKWGLGITAGFSNGLSYKIETDTVKSQAARGINYGPVLRNYYVFNQTWEMQNKFQYLLGDIKQIEASTEFIKTMNKFMLIGGVGYSLREYTVSSGKQTSLSVSLGIGRDF